MLTRCSRLRGCLNQGRTTPQGAHFRGCRERAAQWWVCPAPLLHNRSHLHTLSEPIFRGLPPVDRLVFNSLRTQSFHTRAHTHARTHAHTHACAHTHTVIWMSSFISLIIYCISFYLVCFLKRNHGISGVEYFRWAAYLHSHPVFKITAQHCLITYFRGTEVWVSLCVNRPNAVCYF